MARRKQGPDGSTLKLLLPTLKLVFVDLTACIAFLEDIDRVAGLANAVAGEHTEDEDGNGDNQPPKKDHSQASPPTVGTSPHHVPEGVIAIAARIRERRNCSRQQSGQ